MCTAHIAVKMHTTADPLTQKPISATRHIACCQEIMTRVVWTH